MWGIINVLGLRRKYYIVIFSFFKGNKMNHISAFIKLLILVTTVIVLSTTSSKSENWEKVSGVYPNVHQLFFPSSDSKMVVAASDSGIADAKLKDPYEFVKFFSGNGIVISDDKGLNFSPENTLDSLFVTAISEMPGDPNTWLMAYSKQGMRDIAYSSDKGVTWDFNNSSCNGVDEFTGFVISGGNLFAGSEGNSSGLYFSDDGFETCSNENSPKISIRDLKSAGDIIVGAGVQGIVLSTNAGLDWSYDNAGLDDLRIQCVDYSEEGDGVLLCGADYFNVSLEIPEYEGKGIYLSIDYGQSWSQRGLSGEFVYDIKHHPSYPLFMAAACGYAGVWISADGGLSWNAYNDGLSDIIVPNGNVPDTIPDVRLIEIPDWEKETGGNAGFTVFAGVYNYGLFKSKGINPTLVGIEGSNESTFNIYPNPAKEFIGISSYFGVNSKIKILNAQAQIVLSQEVSGANKIDYKKINLPDNLGPGVYFIEIDSGNGKVYNKFIIGQ